MPDFAAQHEHVLNEAFAIYKRASMIRGQLWLTMPPSDKIRELDERVKRLREAYGRRDELPPDDDPVPFNDALVGDSLDIINHAVFFILQIRAGEYG